MSTAIGIEVIQQALKLIMGSYGITGPLTESTIEAISKSKEKIDDSVDITKLQEEVTRQEAINQISSVQAKALQELAIAKRIDTAQEVEIEEFYEGNGEGGVGVGADAEKVKLGVHGSGSKITRRIYRFKGFREEDTKSFEQLLEEGNKDE